MLRKQLGYIWLIISIILVSCTSSPKPPATSNDYTLELRGGTTNLDASVFNGYAQSPKRATAITDAFTRYAGIALNLPLEPTSDELWAQNNLAIVPNLFVSVTKGGNAPGVPFDVSVSGYTGSIKFSQNESWTVLYPLIPNKSGKYQVTARAEQFLLHEAIDINESGFKQILNAPTTLFVDGRRNLITADLKRATITRLHGVQKTADWLYLAGVLSMLSIRLTKVKSDLLLMKTG